jgi:hypothetical protein
MEIRVSKIVKRFGADYDETRRTVLRLANPWTIISGNTPSVNWRMTKKSSSWSRHGLKILKIRAV